MFSALAVLVYALAFGVPVYLLYRHHAGPWYLHALSLLAALAMGFVTTPESWKSPAFDIVFGAVFVFLAVWGIGGLFFSGSHHAKHA